ncbi:response regulator [Candidatus Uabimicrobium sp. HlEnr_7]|uniref:response regulator n=1 Tax=Candidatus Uabimicrobium helgolandensis TaxID=3095367 RepID=UPI003556ACC2
MMKIKILYVENNCRFVETVCKAFLSEYDVTVVPTINNAKKLAQQQQFTIFIVDYDLDDGKGSEFVRYVRQKKDDSFIIAASSHQKGNEELVNAGANFICAKCHFDKINFILQKLSENNIEKIENYQTNFVIDSDRATYKYKRQNTQKFLNDLGLDF